MKEFTKEEYNQMIIEVVDESIKLNTVNIILSLFIFLELILVFLGVIRFNTFVYVPCILAAVKIWLNDGEMKTNQFVIKYIEDLRDKHNKS
jgi:hypothetical protein